MRVILLIVVFRSAATAVVSILAPSFLFSFGNTYSRYVALGHGSKFCKEERTEIEKVEIKCANCDNFGHRVRDCPQERFDKYACRTCHQIGHNSRDCPDAPADDIQCRRCEQMGHMAKDCPEKGGDSNACRNCGYVPFLIFSFFPVFG